MTLISEETHRVFNDAFFRFGEECLYKEYVLDRQPKSKQNVEDLLKIGEIAGLPGVIGAVDCKHIYLFNCSAE